MNPQYDGSGRGRVTELAGELAGAALALAIVFMVAAELRNIPEPVTTVAPANAMPGGIPAPRSMEPCVMDAPGHLRGTIHGQMARRIAWQGDGFLCDGTPRPGGGGIRLFFAGGATDGDRVVVVIGVDERPERLAGREHPANVTIIDESGSRFYSSRGEDRCWTTVRRVITLPGEPATSWRVDGVFYCAGALPALNGYGSVTLEEFSYSGRVIMNDT